jgi:serine/threonine protein phosphatase 1
MERIFAIGDIHGCYEKLCALLEMIPIDWLRDRLLFIGDYIDRGPSAFDVVEHLLGLQARYPQTIFLKGNHEEMLADYLSGRDRMTYLYNGGRQTLESYLSRAKASAEHPIPPEHMQFFQGLALYHETDDCIFVHAGLRHGLPLNRQSPDDLLWIREKFIHCPDPYDKRVVFGHTPFEKPWVQPDKIGIDTGAVYGNLLTCVQLPEVVFFQA